MIDWIFAGIGISIGKFLMGLAWFALAALIVGVISIIDKIRGK